MNKRFFHGYVAADVNGAVTEEAAALSVFTMEGSLCIQGQRFFYDS